MNNSSQKTLLLGILGVIVIASVVIFSRNVLNPQDGDDSDFTEKDLETYSEEEISADDPPIISSNDLRELIESNKKTIIINPETAENFYKKRIPNSISIPNDQVPTRLDEIPKDSIVIVTSSGSESGCNLSRSTAQLLIGEGYPYVRDHHEGWIGWEKSGYPVVEANEVRVPKISLSDLEKDIENNEEMVIVDIRTPEEYNTSRIKGAINIPFFDYSERKDEIPSNAQLIIYGDKDAKAQQLAIDLIENRYTRVKMLVGGFSSWSVQGLPTISS